MKRAWIDKQNRIAQTELDEVKQEILNQLKQCELLDDEDISIVFDSLKEIADIGLCSFHFPIKLWDKYKAFYKEYCPELHTEAFCAFYLKVDKIFKKLPTEKYFELTIKNYDRYLDSEPMKFDGDILITDPCYIMKKESIDYSSIPDYWDYISTYTTVNRDGKSYYRPPRHEDYPDCKDGKSPTLIAEQEAYSQAKEKWNRENVTDWERCDYGDNMEVLGINNYMTRNTIYGDWSCTVFNSDTKESIGQFCADAGLVSVFSLDEVLKYNPDYTFDENGWSETVIRDFKGTVKFVVKKHRSKKYENFYVEVVGKGINKKTGEPINFVSKQTGF